MELIPVTIVTGFLGAGKTTLLKRVLSEMHGQKIAVIENEFGEESIDNELLVTETKEQVVQLNNGCICCSIREDLRSALIMLAEQRKKGTLDFERVIIETTGVAEPAPVAQTFFIDDDVANSYMLDSIITLVDAKHANQTLDSRVEAQKQVGFADQIFISKADLVTPEHLHALQLRLAKMNPRAKQTTVHFGEVALSEVLDLQGFNLNAKLDLEPTFLEKEDDHGDCTDPHCHEHHHGHHHHHHHEGEHCNHCEEESVPDDEVTSFIFRSKRPIDPAKLEQFLMEVLQVYSTHLLRYKGILYINETDHKVIFQGVHDLMGSDLGPKWQPDETKETKMVFIGTQLPKGILLQGLERCLSASPL